MILRSPYRLDQLAIDILKMIGYSIKDNFGDTNISMNKWYQLLARHSVSTQHGKAYSYGGLPDLHSVELFLKNGASPNQVFHDLEGMRWAPLLLIVDNYLGMHNKQCDPGTMSKLIKVLLDAGADINLKATYSSNKKEASPLSYLLKYDDSNCVIDLLVNFGANIADAILLYLDDSGLVEKTFHFWQKSGSWSLLIWAVEHNSLEAVKLLVNAGAYKHNATLKLAIAKGYGDIISFLMS